MNHTKLEFADGTRLDIESIYGSPQLINGAMRDTLQIEVDPDKINFDSLKAIFSNKDKLEEIHCINIMDGVANEEKTSIGMGYTILVSIADENRVTSPEPGTFTEPITKEVLVVTISQETYAEHQLRILKNN